MHQQAKGYSLELYVHIAGTKCFFLISLTNPVCSGKAASHRSAPHQPPQSDAAAEERSQDRSQGQAMLKGEGNFFLFFVRMTNSSWKLLTPSWHSPKV